MAHEIHIDNGRASMMYVGDAPWHGLGTPLAGPATSAEAIKAANLDWTVIKKPMAAVEGGRVLPVADTYATVRADWWGTQEAKPIFGVVGKNYTPLQNRDAFAFFDDIVGHQAAIYHTAGALGDGERVWILAKLDGEIRVTGDDVTHKYLLLSNSHDGSSSVQLKFTPIRVVCQNTLTMALSRGPAIRVPHFKNLAQRMRHAAKLLGIINGRYGEFEQAFQAMARVQVDARRLDGYLRRVFPDPNDPENHRAAAKAAASRNWSAYFFECGSGQGLPGVSGTLWAAYNGVTEFIDHCVPATKDRKERMGIRSPSAAPPLTTAARARRLESAWFGAGYCAKARAYDVARRWLMSLNN